MRLALALFAILEFRGATVVRHDAAAIDAVVRNGGWIAWTIPSDGDHSIWCGDASLEHQRGITFRDRDRAAATEIVIAMKVENGEIRRIRQFDVSCSINAEGATVHLVSGVTPAQSIRLLTSLRSSDEEDVMAAIASHPRELAVPVLEQMAAPDRKHDTREQALFWLGVRGGDRGFAFLRDFLGRSEPLSLREHAVFALSQSDSREAVPELIRLARSAPEPKIRKESLFWLGQKAGEKAAAELRRAAIEDKDEDVKEHAVFAISQLPRERAVPMLVDLVRTHRTPAVREKALFWLVQTGDDRALELIEEILR